MRLSLIQFGSITAEWAAARLTDDDLRFLERTLMENPDAGQVMRGTGSLRKIRFAPPSRHVGKSGAYRVCYLHVPRHRIIALITMFAKNEQANLSNAEKKIVVQRIAAFQRGLDEQAAQRARH